MHFGQRVKFSSRVFHPHQSRVSWTFSMVAVCLLCLCACTAVKVKLGTRVRLEKTPVSAIQARLTNGPEIAPGQKLPLVVTFTEPNGKVLVTEGEGKGKILWSELQLAATVATVNAKGIVSLPEDPRASEGKVAHVSVTVPTHPDLRAELDIPITYIASFQANFSGSHGADGMSGMDGTSGTSGSSGSTDPNNPSAGGNGSDGTDGSNGQDGDPGGNAPNVQVRVALRPGPPPLLQVSVSAEGQERFYLIDPQGGTLFVRADGGPGGSGGRGGRGGQGGSGGIGTPNGSSGRNGSDGRSGSDGPRGKGGSIRVIYDPLAKPFLGVIHYSNVPGPGPVFQQEPVGPLW